MFTAWSIIASFDYFEDVDCPENVFVRNINWNLISFVVFLNRCLSLYRLSVALMYYTWSRKYHPVRTISFTEKNNTPNDIPLVNQYTPIKKIQKSLYLNLSFQYSYGLQDQMWTYLSGRGWMQSVLILIVQIYEEYILSYTWL